MASEIVDWMLALRRPQAAHLPSLEPRVAELRGKSPLISGRAAPGSRDERERILDATVTLAARDGYAHLSGPRIRAAAGITRKAFERSYEDVEDCFADAISRLTGRAMRRAARAGLGAPNWPRGVYRAIEEMWRLALVDPMYAKLVFVEALAAGPARVRNCDVTTGLAATVLRASAPAAQRPAELAAEASVGAIWGLMHRSVRAGCTRRLQRGLPALAYLALAPAVGTDAALDSIAAECGASPRERRRSLAA